MIKRGNIYWYCFPDFSYHPAVVIQNDKGNKFSSNVIVAKMASSERIGEKARSIPTIIRIEPGDIIKAKGEFELNNGGYVLTSNIHTLHKEDLEAYAGHFTRQGMNKVDKAIRISLNLGREG